MDNKCLQQGRDFKYLSCEISYENEKVIQQKLAKFSEILGILNHTFKPNLVQKFSRIQVYNSWLFPLLYIEGRKKYIKRLTSIVMKIFGRTAGTPFLTTK